MSQGDATPDPIATLERWEQHGGVWRSASLTSTGATVELCTCHGEPVEELRSSDPELLAYLERRRRSSGAGRTSRPAG